MRLGLIADTPHYRDAEGRLCTLLPVVRQLELWTEWFDELIVCAPLLKAPPPPNCIPYQRFRVTIRPLKPAGGAGLRHKLGLLPSALSWWGPIRRTLHEADGLHFRCPSNVGFIGLLATQGADCPRHAVYTGQWNNYAGESPFYRWQKRLLGNPRFGGPVAIYGDWPRQAPHLVSSFAPSFTLAEWEAEEPLIQKRLRFLEGCSSLTPRLVMVGQLDQNKGQAAVLEAVSRLHRMGLDVKLTCVGDGPHRDVLRLLRSRLGLDDVVALTGRLAYRSVCARYRQSDFNLLASRVESFGKVLTEGMLHGAVPIASKVGITSQILGAGRRGRTFPWAHVEALVQAICELSDQPAQVAEMIRAGREYTRNCTLDAYADLHRRMLQTHWGNRLPPSRGAFATPHTLREQLR